MSRLIKFALIVVSLFQIYCSQPTTIAVLPAIRDVSIANENEAWIVTDKGKVLHLTNDGQTKKEIKFEAAVRQIYFLNANEGWVLDSEGQIWATSNNGKDWLRKGNFGSDISSTDLAANLIFLDSQTGWMINSFSVLLTEDGGNSWNQVYPNKDFSYTTLESQPMTFFPVNKNTGWLGMSNGKVLRTTNHGNSWEDIIIPAKADIHSLYAFSDNQCLVAAWNTGGLYYTDNGGKKWQQKLDVQVWGNLGISSISFATPEIGWIVGIEFDKDSSSHNKLNGIVLKTTDGGKTWRRMENEVYKNPFREIKAIDAQNVWLIGEKSIYRTTDGGNNWKMVFQTD